MATGPSLANFTNAQLLIAGRILEHALARMSGASLRGWIGSNVTPTQAQHALLQEALAGVAQSVKEADEQRKRERIAREQRGEANLLAPFLAGALLLKEAQRPLEIGFYVTPSGFIHVRIDGETRKREDFDKLPRPPGAPIDKRSLRYLAALAVAGGLPFYDLDTRHLVARMLFPESKPPPAKRKKPDAEREEPIVIQ